MPTEVLMSFNMVPGAGLEPACLSTGDFKSPVYTISPPGHILYHIKVHSQDSNLPTLPIGNAMFHPYLLGLSIYVL